MLYGAKASLKKHNKKENNLWSQVHLIWVLSLQYLLNSEYNTKKTYIYKKYFIVLVLQVSFSAQNINGMVVNGAGSGPKLQKNS
jgi:hypothetical protein